MCECREIWGDYFAQLIARFRRAVRGISTIRRKNPPKAVEKTNPLKFLSQKQQKQIQMTENERIVIFKSDIFLFVFFFHICLDGKL